MRETPNGRLDPALVAALAAAELPDDLVHWLARLNVLLGVPFTYLVADELLLPPESIKFFQVDPSWMGALVDGALSIGRHYSDADAIAPSLVAEQVHRPRLHDAVGATVPAIRRRQLTQPANGDLLPVRGVTSGFLLRSQVVAGWKSMDVVGYARGGSPHDNEQGRIAPDQIRPLDILRLELLSPTVLFGLFAGQLYQLVLHQPPEAIHFGFQTVDLSANGVTKALRTPTTNWDDPDTGYDTQTYRHQALDDVFTDGAHRVVNMFRLSQALAHALDGVGAAPGYYQAAPDASHQDHLLSSDYALEMVQGVGLVSFINDALPEQDLA
jgi:hypothetical protein